MRTRRRTLSCQRPTSINVLAEHERVLFYEYIIQMGLNGICLKVTLNMLKSSRVDLFYTITQYLQKLSFFFFFFFQKPFLLVFTLYDVIV